MLAIMLVGVPSFLSDPVSLSMVGNVAAQSNPEDRQFVIGVEGELGVSTLNPNTYTMMVEAMLIFPCYSGLLQYDMDSQLTGDAAYSWSSTPDMLTWYFELYPEIYFCDPANPYDKSHQLTAEDVIWSYDMYQTNLLSRLHPSLPSIDGEPLIMDMGLVNDDPLHMYMELSSSYAPFLGAMSLPILPKYYWESEDPQRFLDDEVPIGSGPFFYNVTGPPSGQTAKLYRNPIWHCEQWLGWQNHIDVIFLETQLNEGTAWQALQAGEIDVQLGFDAATYTTTLFETDFVTGFAQSQGFVYEFNLNQLTDELRSEIGGTFNSGSNNQILLNLEVREAFAMCIDKQEFIDEVAQGLGSVSTSLVPDVNPGVYEYGSTPGEVPFVFDTAAARQKLVDAGWAYDALGNDAGPDTLPLCREDGEDPLSFDFISPDGDEWKAACAQIVSWVAEAGIVLDYTPKSISQMNTAWYGANYDVWLWDWIFGPLNDPSTDCLCVLTTDAIGVDSDIYMSNPTFDALYNESLVTMDPALRYEIVADMQRLVYEQAACQSLAYRQDLYGVSTSNWMNFGDWNTTYMLLPDNTCQYTGMLMSPTDNEAPHFTGINSSIEGKVGQPITIEAYVADDDLTTPLDMRWYWGDLDRSAWDEDIGIGSATASMQ
ncbi:MAG: ABC transporter substrate-binding protein, partial [Thermoplasmata archaeon]|nr:ABC transporter substrate-binding protein [Thermoplasmata archaeon]